MSSAFEKAPLPHELLVPGAIAIGDIDGDGLGDVLVGVVGASSATASTFRYYRSRGDGTFEDRSTSHVPGNLYGLAPFVLADVDNDGNVDVVGTTRLLRNRQGLLLDGPLPATNSNRQCVAAADVDGDGDVDLFMGVGFAGSASRQDQLLLNLGGGTFQPAPAGRLPIDNDDTQAACFFDADNDGDQDLVVGLDETSPGTGGARLYTNDGSGTFSNASAAFPVAPQDVTSLVAADFDLDGDVDVVVGTAPSTQVIQPPDLFLRNLGGGQFAAAANVLPPILAATRHVVAADLDADGDRDLLLAEGGTAPASPRVYRNDLQGFTDVTSSWLPTGVHVGGFWAVGDVDGDGVADAVFVAGGAPSSPTGSVQVFLGRGGTTFLPLNPSRRPAESWLGGMLSVDGQFVDVDGDGDRDWFAPAAAYVPLGFPMAVLLRNDGQGRFASATASLPLVQDAKASRFADVDGDGDLDLLLVTATAVVQWRNDGAGNFTPAPPAAMPGGMTSLADISVGDVDGDGDVDAFVGRSGFSMFDELLRNDGTGVFTRDTTALPTHMDAQVRASTMLDYDGDGDLDIVLSLGLQNGTLTVYRNLGAGQFQLATGVVPPGQSVTRIQPFDADGDGDLDLLVNSFDVVLLLDQGSTFAAAVPTGAASLWPSAGNPHVFDFEGDGDLDIAVTQFGEWRLLRNDGGFVYSVRPGKLLVDTVSGRFTAGDADGDGDADFVVQQVYRGAQILLGRRLQLHSPLIARVGKPWALELSHLEAEIGRADGALFAINFARLSPALPLPPLGVLHVDPAGALLSTGVLPFVSPTQARPAPTGLVCRWVLPNAQALLGATIYAQALSFGPGHTLLSNLVFDQVR